MIPKYPFGKTDHMSSRIIFGGAALGEVSQKEADGVLELLLQHGVNHIDTASTYGDSELRIGPWMEHHRGDFFLATKMMKRTYQEAREEFHRSLERLRVDGVDLLQLHFLVDPEEWQTAIGPGGALEAAIEARQQGLTRFIGVTGHEIAVAQRHLGSLERFDFDAVLLPYNYPMLQNMEYATNFEKVVKLCQSRQVAIQTIKSLARRPWGDKSPTWACWYEPLEEQADIDRAVHWVLRRPAFFLNTVADIHLLPRVLDAASRFDPDEAPTEEQMQAMVNRLGMAPLFT